MGKGSAVNRSQLPSIPNRFAFGRERSFCTAQQKAQSQQPFTQACDENLFKIICTQEWKKQPHSLKEDTDTGSRLKKRKKKNPETKTDS